MDATHEKDGKTIIAELEAELAALDAQARDLMDARGDTKASPLLLLSDLLNKAQEIAARRDDAKKQQYEVGQLETALTTACEQWIDIAASVAVTHELRGRAWALYETLSMVETTLKHDAEAAERNTDNVRQKLIERRPEAAVTVDGVYERTVDHIRSELVPRAAKVRVPALGQHLG